MRVLRVPHLKEADYSDVEGQLKAIFYRILFKPLVDVLKAQGVQGKEAAKELRNAPVDVVVAAIESGRVQYGAGVFSGTFNARIADSLRSLGAVKDKRSGTYTMDKAKVPPDIISTAFRYTDKTKAIHAELEKRLDEIEAGLEGLVDANTVDATAVVGRMDRNFQKVAGDALGREELTEEARARLSAEYSTNMKLWIQKWSEEAILDLRTDVEANASEGYRFDRLVPRIQHRYGVSQNKARFLARQETALLTAKHREVRFVDAGLNEYVWRITHDAHVRPDHKALHGRRFRYDSPPVVDQATGRRGNPGQDYNCRCVDEPVLTRGERFLDPVGSR